MGRDQHPFVGQRIQAAVRIFREFQVLASEHSTTRARLHVQSQSYPGRTLACDSTHSQWLCWDLEFFR
jgi:hypothetical protein